MVRTQIQLTEDQAEAIKKLARAKKISMAEFIRQSVEKILASTAIADTAQRKKRALDIAGRFSSGKHDIAAEHDAYLAEAYDQ